MKVLLEIAIFNFRFLETTIELQFEEQPGSDDPILKSHQKLLDNFYLFGTFDSNGVAEIKIDSDLKVSAVRLSVHKSSENWAILSEIYFKSTS